MKCSNIPREGEMHSCSKFLFPAPEGTAVQLEKKNVFGEEDSRYTCTVL